jgi:hypothetical protein
VTRTGAENDLPEIEAGMTEVMVREIVNKSREISPKSALLNAYVRSL